MADPPWLRYGADDQQPQQPLPPWQRYGEPSPPTASGITVTKYNVDPNLSWDELQKQIGGMNETQRTQAVEQWSNAQEKKASAEGGIGRNIDTAVRSLAQGIPGGTWADEANAWIASKLPAAMGGMPYEQAIALQHARDRRIAAEHPIANVAGNVAGGVASAVAAPAVLPARAAAYMFGANVLPNAALGAIQGSGEGDTLGERAQHAAIGAGVAGATAGLLGGVGRAYNRWSQVTPEVQQAADAIYGQGGTPFYFRAEDPKVQALGRRAAQNTQTSAVPQVQQWEGLRTGFSDAAERAQSAITGVPAAQAPAEAGVRIGEGMRRSAQNLTGEMGQLAGETASQMPAGYRADPANLRRALGEVIATRTEAGATNPNAGLEDLTNFVTQPGGVSWPGLQTNVTETGQMLGLPKSVPRPISQSALETIYPALREDQRAMVRSQLGAPGVEAFNRNVDTQAQLAGLRSEIASAADTKEPEQLVKMFANAATLKQGGTQLDKLSRLASGLSQPERDQIGAAVLAHLQNQTKTPQALAAAIDAIPDNAKAMLWRDPQLRDQVERLRVLGNRFGGLENFAHRGSAGSWGDKVPGFSILKHPVAGPVATMALGGAAHAANIPYAIPLTALTVAGELGGRALAAGRRQLLQRGLPAAPQRLQDAAAALTGGIAPNAAPWTMR